MKVLYKDLLVLFISVLIIVSSLGCLLSRLSINSNNSKQQLTECVPSDTSPECQPQDFHPTIVPAFFSNLENAKWVDIFLLLIVWSAGVFFNKSLSRVVKSFYKSDFMK